MPYLEILKESRIGSMGINSSEQEFVYVIANEDFDGVDGSIPDDWTVSDATYGTFFAPNSDVALINYVAATFPLFRKTRTLSGVDVILILGDFHFEELQPDVWKIRLKYTIPEDQSEGSGEYVQFGFSVGNNVEHVSRATTIDAVQRSGSTLLPPDTMGCIGVTKNGIEGADLPARGMRFNITNFFSPTIWDTSFMQTFNGVATCYNNAPFFGFQTGEVLFIGADGQGDAYHSVPIKFEFVAKYNIVDMEDPGFPDLNMLGHDILDYLYIQETSNDYQINAPYWRYVHRHFQPGNFTLLGF